MTSSRILFPQFRDEQSSSKYPFADGCTLTANTGFKIDNDLFVDASFFGIGLVGRVYLSSVTVTAQFVTFAIGDSAGANKLTGQCDLFNLPDTGVISFVDTYGRPAGILLAEKEERAQSGEIKKTSPLSRLGAWPVGRHAFTAAATAFVATAVIPANEPGVRAITPETTQLMTGDIWLVGNGGVVLRNEGENTIRIDIVGVPLFSRFVCAPQTEFPTKKFLRTINNCGPDDYGNFVITATDKSVAHPTLRVSPVSDNELTFDTIGPKVT